MRLAHYPANAVPSASPIYTAHAGDNATLISEVARLYLHPMDRVADVTYGKGAFWRKVDLTRLDFFPSDIETGTDFRALPDAGNTFDVVVLDPPYMHNPGRPQVNARYRNGETTKGMGHNDIVQLYHDGMAEAYRVLKPGGLLWVKTQDEIESGRQRWTHIELKDRADALGFTAEDLFVLTRPCATLQVPRQLHARKNHSYLWIFRKGGR